MQFIQIFVRHNHLKAHIFYSYEETRKYVIYLFYLLIAFTEFIHIHYTHIYKWARRPTKVSTLLPFVRYVGCFKDTVYPYPSHLYNYFRKKCLHFKHLALFTPRQLYPNWLNSFTAVLPWFDSLMMVTCGPIHIKAFSVILQYKYLRNKFVHFVSLVLWTESNIVSCVYNRKMNPLFTFVSFHSYVRTEEFLFK